MQAIIFDFNGVIADDETPHFFCFRQALKESGLSLTSDEYYGTYLGMDERTCTRILLTHRDGVCNDDLLERVTLRKAELFRIHTANHRPEFFPGVVEFVQAAGRRYRLAIASGGRRSQIDAALGDTPIEQVFEVIVAAEDCPVGKPDPAIYRLTLERLNRSSRTTSLLGPRNCFVIEDSLAGIQSAQAAGMPVLAVATTYPIEKLNGANLVTRDLRQIPPDSLLERMAQISNGSHSEGS
ncbi:MAG TPA: HAD family phosphatase [Nitrospira sp.]|nr:HAD family phosphatase [Nitrospira sp.]